ncbi:MAG: HNH endonuclease [Chloroflexi bacterium]|nr:MAG: HNH endonuclease [Chloroflexota bacterium]
MEKLNHYVVYHNTEKRGYSIEDELSVDEFGISTNKTVDSLIGSTIWVISGAGKPRSYTLSYVFIVDNIGNLRNQDFKYFAEGTMGLRFLPSIPLNKLPWFKGFLESQFRFNFGLREIDQKYIKELESLVDNQGAENPDSIILSPSLLEFEQLEIDQLTNEDYKLALTNLKGALSATDLRILKANYESDKHTITATKLANRVGFANFAASNLRYGLLARKFCEFFQIQPNQYLSILVNFKKIENEWHWIMRPELVSAIRELELFRNYIQPNILQDLEEQKDTYDSIPGKTTRKAITESRIGQGKFRADLINYWQGCAVTGCVEFELLRASHIKPWCKSNNIERLDLFNGLLLIPNLDVAFDRGFISFRDDGQIIIGHSLNEETLLQLGINHSMQLRIVEHQHIHYLKQHRKLHLFE